MNQKHQAFLLPEDPSQWSAPEECKPTAAQHQPIDARGACWNNRVLESLDLRQANLCRIDIRGADLRGMDLENTNFMGAYLSGCDLSGAVLDRARFVGADLRFAKNARQSLHRRTLYR